MPALTGRAQRVFRKAIGANRQQVVGKLRGRDQPGKADPWIPGIAR
ncbi:hypothetical protein [Accumulibacter sp.]|nr:hypothetical protein [Accumulibacter sp.]